jgi:hypothetical protein
VHPLPDVRVLGHLGPEAETVNCPRCDQRPAAGPHLCPAAPDETLLCTCCGSCARSCLLAAGVIAEQAVMVDVNELAEVAERSEGLETAMELLAEHEMRTELDDDAFVIRMGESVPPEDVA